VRSDGEGGEDDRVNEDRRIVSLRLDPATTERLLAWAEQAGVAGDIDAAARLALAAFLDDQPPQMPLPLGVDLTPTEREVMQRSARGQDATEIALAMDLAPGTVSQARYRAVRKGAPGRERATLGQLRERAFERAAGRVLGAGAEVDEAEAVAFLRPPADVRDGAEPQAPDAVRLGVPRGDRVGRVWEDDARPFRAPRKARPLSGLTNRIAPTLWASTRLVLLAGDEGPVTPARLLASVVPDAWRIGAGLDAWEEEQRRLIQSRPGAKRRGVPFHFSARWPSLSGPETREASSVVGFVTFSLGDWRGTGSAVSGPLFTLGLAELLPTRSKTQPLYLRPTRKAVDLAQELGMTDASCWYPYDDAAWRAIRECLRSTPTLELDRLVRALRVVGESEGTADFQEGIARAFDLPETSTGSRRASEAGGHLARLRELGLVTIPGAYDLDLYRLLDVQPRIDAPAFGPDAITARGQALLDYEGAAPPRRRKGSS
jgi:DNA-binding CsgD family transcriptional regulator